MHGLQYLFLRNSCSGGVPSFRFWAAVGPSVHVYLWEAKGRDLYM